MMSELRWLLIIIGVVIIIAVYAYSKYRGHAKNEKEFSYTPPRHDPLVDETKSEVSNIPSLHLKVSETDNEVLPGISASKANKSEGSRIKLSPKQLSDDKPILIVLHVWARSGQYWQGEKLMQVATKAGLTASDKNIFQYFHQNNSAIPLFHVANKNKPGTFEWDRMKQFKTQGVSLFMELPVYFSAYDAFLLMHACAERLSNLLDGEILDQSYKPIEKKTIDEIHRLCSDMDAKP